MLQRYILFWLVTSSALAFVWPDFGLPFDPFLAVGSSAINRLIVVTMFCVGALLPIDEVNLILRRWPTVLIGTTIQYISMPLLAWLVVKVTNPDPQIALGILIVGCVPGAMASNVLTLTAKGNVSYSVSLTTSATLLSPLVVPLALWLTVAADVNYNGWEAVKLLLTQVVLPVIFGHLLSRFSAAFRTVAELGGATIANITIMAIIAIAIAGKRTELGQASFYLLLSLSAINASGYLAGYFGGRAFRLPEPMRRALTLEVGMQNAGAGIVLARQLFGDDSPAVIPCVLYTFGCMLTGTILATVWHYRPHAEAAVPPLNDLPVKVELSDNNVAFIRSTSPGSENIER